MPKYSHEEDEDNHVKELEVKAQVAIGVISVLAIVAVNFMICQIGLLPITVKFLLMVIWTSFVHIYQPRAIDGFTIFLFASRSKRVGAEKEFREKYRKKNKERSLLEEEIKDDEVLVLQEQLNGLLTRLEKIETDSQETNISQ